MIKFDLQRAWVVMYISHDFITSSSHSDFHCSCTIELKIIFLLVYLKNTLKKIKKNRKKPHSVPKEQTHIWDWSNYCLRWVTQCFPHINFSLKFVWDELCKMSSERLHIKYDGVVSTMGRFSLVDYQELIIHTLVFSNLKTVLKSILCWK